MLEASSFGSIYYSFKIDKNILIVGEDNSLTIVDSTFNQAKCNFNIQQGSVRYCNYFNSIHTLIVTKVDFFDDHKTMLFFQISDSIIELKHAFEINQFVSSAILYGDQLLFSTVDGSIKMLDYHNFELTEFKSPSKNGIDILKIFNDRLISIGSNGKLFSYIDEKWEYVTDLTENYLKYVVFSDNLFGVVENESIKFYDKNFKLLSEETSFNKQLDVLSNDWFIITYETKYYELFKPTNGERSEKFHFKTNDTLEFEGPKIPIFTISGIKWSKNASQYAVKFDSVYAYDIYNKKIAMSFDSYSIIYDSKFKSRTKYIHPNEKGINISIHSNMKFWSLYTSNRNFYTYKYSFDRWFTAQEFINYNCISRITKSGFIAIQRNLFKIDFENISSYILHEENPKINVITLPSEIQDYLINSNDELVISCVDSSVILTNLKNLGLRMKYMLQADIKKIELNDNELIILLQDKTLHRINLKDYSLTNNIISNVSNISNTYKNSILVTINDSLFLMSNFIKDFSLKNARIKYIKPSSNIFDLLLVEAKKDRCTFLEVSKNSSVGRDKKPNYFVCTFQYNQKIFFFSDDGKKFIANIKNYID
jgi:hypothetical protein